MERTKNIYPETARRLERREKLALATILETTGSTPQVPGASALFAAKGLVCGTLGGGILEADAQKRANVCLKKKISVCYEFELYGDGTSDEAICGGSAFILMDAAPVRSFAAFRRMQKSLLARKPGVLLTRIETTGAGKTGIRRFWLEEGRVRTELERRGLLSLAGDIKEARREAIPRLLKAEKEGREGGRILLFLELLTPRSRLVIAGAGHIGQAVARLGKLLDFEVTVIDDRAEYANSCRFPEADAVVVGDIGPTLKKFPVSRDTYIVIVTRGHSHDGGALRACIQRPAAYIGMIGSSRKVGLMREEFLRKGWASGGQFDRVHAPIGLKIGSKTVEEIAVSIAAELVLVRSRIQDEKGP